MSLRDKFWMWGYAQEKPGTVVPFCGSIRSHCSLETAASYFGMPNVVFMNGMHSQERLEENLALIQDSKQILCGLPHGQEQALAAASRLVELAKRFPAIRGVVLDDFLQLSGHPTTTEGIAAIRRALEPAGLELFVVMYSDVNHLELTPYLPLIDGIILWRWVSTEHFWRAEFGPLIHRFKAEYGKKLFHGLYLQNFGEHSSSMCPQEFELWKMQCMKVLEALRGSYAFLDGCVLLQNAHVSHPMFRDHVIWFKQTLDWFLATTTERA
ncbi:MAG: hypothetical protein IJJ33_01280 [Victivallales bacterium]|nr:hypothetical protein [Victivallales bacterium]